MHTASLETTSGAASSAEPLYLTFALAGQDYGVPITQVQEIRKWSKLTPLPNSPPHVKGVLNLRGTIVPVVDMRLRFGFEEKTRDAFTVIVVVNVGQRLAGLVVDTVSDVLRVSGNERCTLAEFEGHANRSFIEGLAQVDGRLLILLNVEKLLRPDELAVAGSGEVEGRT